MNGMSCGMMAIGAFLIAVVALVEVTHPHMFHTKRDPDCVREIKWQDAMKETKRDVNAVCPAL